MKSKTDERSTGDESESSSGSDSSDDEVEELPVVQKTVVRKPRTSVSAEAFGNWNKKEDFKAPFFPKSDEQLEALKKRLE
jgi:cAMP-dependent protein kinase regulator